MNKRLANIIYILQNLAVPILVFVFIWQSLPALAYLTVLLSKWRIVAIGPHFWLANLRSNAADIIVGLSTVALMNTQYGTSNIYVLLFFAILYGIWLLFIKPRSGTGIVFIQAFVSQLYGLTALYLLVDTVITSFTWVVILLAWVIGRVSARHFLSAYSKEVPERPLIIALWGFVVVQFAWVFWIWNVIYQLPQNVFAIPLIGLIVSVLGYAVGSIVHAKQTNKLEQRFVLQQFGFLLALLIVIVYFTGWTGEV